ncbi:MAG: FGGY family carbohydrate kinase [Gammaproteobacteria bacterium]|nr:FGGY family carbohydrate kinase [Gammaproteobacteria bacterium]
MPYTLVIDQGTHASRAILFSADRQIVAHAEKSIQLLRIDHETIEQDAVEILQSIDHVVTHLPAEKLQQAKCCGICTQRSTVLAWRKDTGQPLSPAISWQDRRSQQDLDQFQSRQARIHEITGLPLSAHYGAGKFRWLLKHNPQVQQALAEDNLCMGPLVSYLLHHLLLNKPHLVDYSNAHRSLLFDIARRDWSNELLDLFTIPAWTLPACKPMLHDYGELIFNTIPVTAVCGDQNASIYAQGPIDPHSAMVNLGTGAFVLSGIDTIHTDTSLLCSVALGNDVSTAYLLEGTINGCGAALDWLQQQEPVDHLFDDLPDWLHSIQSPPLFINTISGLGSPWWKEGPAACFLGDETASVESRYVAVIESIVFLIQHNLDEIQRYKTLDKIHISGGLSKLDGLCQKLANLSALPVVAMPDTEATAHGAAWLAQQCPPHIPPAHSSRRFSTRSDTGLLQRFQLFSDEISSI